MRELPRLDDGLRDVERRLLRTLDRLGVPARFKKTTRVLTQAIGDVPDARPLEELLTARRPWRATRDPLLSAYATLVDMAVPFRTRIPLVEGRGNFGTQHGDPPADHMYTECRLSPWGAAVLGGAPNLLVNGARADASRVFHFLPHNLGEVVDALV
ncbi:MAG: DNA gyrase subunit A, partial [Polyangiales bacterium]